MKEQGRDYEDKMEVFMYGCFTMAVLGLLFCLGFLIWLIF